MCGKKIISYMKTSQFILLFALLSYCSTQETDDECQTQFDRILTTKCTGINSGCILNNQDKKCYQTSPCNIDDDSSKCKQLIHPDFHKYKCIYESSKCKQAEKKCSDYGKATPSLNDHETGYTVIEGDECDKLEPEKEGQACVLIGNSCQSLYISCANFDINTCNGKLLSDGVHECEWGKANADSTRDTCNPVPRYCDNTIWNPSKETCSKLKITYNSTPKVKACIYNEVGDRCEENYISCDNTYYNNDKSYCETQRPSTLDNKEYNYLQKCSWDSGSSKCKAVGITCEDYPTRIASADICESLPVSDSTNKRCVYGINGCHEEYKTCQGYSEKEIEKTRNGCESIKLDDPNKKCVYISEEDTCIESKIYDSCEAYNDGDDKRICESILSPTTNQYCILDKDSVCKERTFNCSDVVDEYECLHIAKPVDKNKVCAYYNGECYEEFKKCDDYTGNNEDKCSNIKLHNQKKCEMESNKCRPVNKKCRDARSKEECELIAQTGVSNPDKKICDYHNGRCIENYKYCSDYRGTDRTICSQIKPYNKEGTEIDITSKCTYEDYIGCQRVPKDCSDAHGNPILCAKISPLIKDNNVKYCAYIDGQCQEHFKSCESYDTDTGSFEAIKCRNIIPENYLTGTCQVEWDSSEKKFKCVTQKVCSSFTPASLETLCKQINLNCTYSGSHICTSEVKNYNQINFYKENEANEVMCKSFNLTSPYYKNYNVTLSEDKTTCERVYKEPNYFYDSSYDHPNSSQSIAKGFYLIITLLCLLF